MIPLEVIHQGAARMQEIDPHGFTLSLVAVVVVFSALLVLFLFYSLSGAVFTGKFSRRHKSGPPDADTAAAIAMALELYSRPDDDATAAVIAAALHMYASDGVHDVEPGIITIRRDVPGTWGDKSLTLRKKPSLK